MSTDPVKRTGHYIHQMTYNHRERMVGLFVFSAFVLFLALVIISGQSQHLFEKRVKFYINVDSSEGISQGSVVKALGTEVGHVSDLSYTQGGKIRLTIEVYEGRRTLIRTGARAIVNRLASISNASIDIASDAIDAPMLVDGSTIPVKETPSLNGLLLGMASIIQSAEKHNLLSKLETMLPKLELTLENAYKIITQIATGHGTLGAAVFDQHVEQELKVLVTSGAKALLQAEGIIGIAKQRLVQLEPVLNDAKYMSKDMRIASENIPEMVKQLDEIITQTKTALTLINGELQHIPGVASDTRRTLAKTRRLLDSVQNTWPLSGNSSTLIPQLLILPHPSYD